MAAPTLSSASAHTGSTGERSLSDKLPCLHTRPVFLPAPSFRGIQLPSQSKTLPNMGSFHNSQAPSTRSSMPAKKTESDAWIASSLIDKELSRNILHQKFEIATSQTNNGEIAALSASLEDWKSFRARLCKWNFNDQSQTEASKRTLKPFDDTCWAHQIPMFEKGCVLVATEKLDCHPFLCKSVVILVHCSEGSIRGVILNRRLPFPLEDVKNVDTGVVLGLAACPAFLGGPLGSASEFHLLSSNNFLRGFDKVLPGINVGREAALFSTISSLRRGKTKAEEVNVHVGQLEWEPSILSAEVSVFEWWRIVSCSSSLLLGRGVENLWGRIDSRLSLGL